MLKDKRDTRREMAKLRRTHLTTAWKQLGLPNRSIARIETIQDEKQRSVYRLVLDGDDASPVIAKRAPVAEANREIPFYTEVLPAIGLPTLEYYGGVEGVFSKEKWLFMEDAAGKEYDRQNEAHRVLAGSWLGELHAAGVVTELPELDLRDRGTTHYHGDLTATRSELETNMDNPLLTDQHLHFLSEFHERICRLEAAWPSLAELMSHHPRTFVHGDFKPDNLRIRHAADKPELLVFDWNEGGRGVPALDLSRFLVSVAESVGTDAGAARRNFASSIHRLAPDLDAYLKIVRPVWPDLDVEVVRMFGLMGELFHCIATVRWVSARLAYSYVEYPVENLRTNSIWLSSLMQDLQIS